MELVLLSGGSGKRLWPLSNDVRSKQFLKVVKDSNGNIESMVQRVYRQITLAQLDADVTLVTSVSQVESIKSQLGDKVSVVVEPARRNTFPAILLSAAYLYFEKKCSLDETVIILPVDPYVDVDYFCKLAVMDLAVQKNVSDIVLMGVMPTYPAEKYGYIIPAEHDKKVNRVLGFKEKPDRKAAEEFIKQGGLWNCGIFALKLSYLMDIIWENINCSSYEDVLRQYSLFEKTSFDYAVVEKSNSVAVISYAGEWKDLGTWNELTNVMESNYIGEVRMSSNCKNTHVINEFNIPVVVIGVENAIVVASPDGILVSEKEQSAEMKRYIDNLDLRPMYEERSWGEYKVLDSTVSEDGIKAVTKRKVICQGNSILMHNHEKRSEVWTIISGRCMVYVGNDIREAKEGDTFRIPESVLHRLDAIVDTVILETQIGLDLVDDGTSYIDEIL